MSIGNQVQCRDSILSLYKKIRFKLTFLCKGQVINPQSACMQGFSSIFVIHSIWLIIHFCAMSESPMLFPTKPRLILENAMKSSE